MRNIYILLIGILFLSACQSTSNSKKAEKVTAQPFPFTQVPAMISNEAQKSEYAVKHFWNDYFVLAQKSCRDTLLVGGVGKDSFTKAFTTYISLLEVTSPETIKIAQDSLLTKAERIEIAHPESIIWDKIISLSEKYLFDPNSPYRNEECYIPVLEKMGSTSIVSDDEKTRSLYLLSLCSLNRLEHKAANFTYTLKNGRTGQLYDTKSEYILLFFSNPDCENCKEIIEQLSKSQKIQQLIEQKRLAVINIYPDEDLTAWYDYLPNYPETWINGFDQEQVLNSKTIYYIRAIPSLYLLNKEKEVIYKDAPPFKIFQYLNSI